MIKQYIFFVFFITVFQTTAQEIAFEFIIEKENTRISTGQFIQDQHDYLVGPVMYRYFVEDTLNSTYSRIYKITEDGDTSSILFNKPDTLFTLQIVNEVNDEGDGYLLWGAYYHADAGATEQIEVLIRTDYDLNILWERHFNLGYHYVASGRKMLQTSKDELLFACNPNDVFDMYLLKLSATGDSLDFRYYEGDSAGSVQSLTYNFDSTGFFIHTWGAYIEPGTVFNSLIEINENLEQVDVKFYPDWYDRSYETILWPGNNLLSAGYEKEINGSAFDKYFTAYILDADLKVIEKRRLSSPDTASNSAWFRNMDVVDTSFIYVGGSFNGHYHSSNDTSWFYIAMLDYNLDIIYEKYIGGDMHYWCDCITATHDGGVFMSGLLFPVDETPIFHKAYLVKLDTTGIPLDIDKPGQLKFYDALIYPNPGNDHLNIRTTLKNAKFELYDINGKLLINQAINKHITTINTDHLPTGMYVYNIYNKCKVLQTGKWINK
jgi:hypothetical protein